MGMDSGYSSDYSRKTLIVEKRLVIGNKNADDRCRIIRSGAW
jgi:hypothetical protein